MQLQAVRVRLIGCEPPLQRGAKIVVLGLKVLRASEAARPSSAPVRLAAASSTKNPKWPRVQCVGLARFLQAISTISAERFRAVDSGGGHSHPVVNHDERLVDELES